ncbi:MAG: hypothetical protein ABSD43_14330 [Terracidiphilus sp.]|jgi:hypothetical protein
MKRLTVLFLISLWATTAAAVDPPEHRTTIDQAEALVMASLTAQQSRLPSLGIEPEPPSPGNPSRFLFFEVTWEGTPNGSVVVGNFAVDPYTGDVFSSTMSCYEEKNKHLEALQRQVRATLHLTQAEYQKLRTTGPLCEH